MVLGISPDSVERQAKFRDQENLPFNLLADVEHEVAEKYGVWIEKKMYGRTYWGNERSSFLIDAEGKIVRRWDKVKVDGHAEEVRRAVAAL